MKKISLFLLVAFVTFLYGCGSTLTDPLPSGITVDVPATAPSTANVGDRISFNVTVTAPATLSKIEVKKSGSVIDTKTSFTGTTSQYTFVYTVLPADGGKNIEFRISAEDIKGNSKGVDYIVSINAPTTSNTDVKLLNQNAATLASAGSFYASSTKTISNSANAVVANVDITYGIVGGNPSFVSPDARTKYSLAVGTQTGWTKTKFATSPLNFDTVTSKDLLSAAAPTADIVTATANGVYLFENAAGKRGIIKVKTFTKNGSATTDVDVTFDIKVIQ